MMGEIDIDEEDAINLIEDEVKKFEEEKIVRIYHIVGKEDG